eukprot:323156-Prymnesium_polylepis.1
MLASSKSAKTLRTSLDGRGKRQKHEQPTPFHDKIKIQTPYDCLVSSNSSVSGHSGGGWVQVNEEHLSVCHKASHSTPVSSAITTLITLVVNGTAVITRDGVTVELTEEYNEWLQQFVQETASEIVRHLLVYGFAAVSTMVTAAESVSSMQPVRRSSYLNVESQKRNGRPSQTLIPVVIDPASTGAVVEFEPLSK